MTTKNPIESVPKKTFSKRKFIFQIALILMALAFGVLTFLAKTKPYFSVDLVISSTIQSVAFPFFDPLMHFVSLLGDLPVAVLSVIAVSLLFLALSKRRDSFLILISTIAVTVFSVFIKLLVDRPRPDKNLVIQLVPLEQSASFPSGHVLFFMGFYGLILFLAFTQLKNEFLRWLVVLVCLTFILLIGVSRIYLGMHWFSDVLGSYLLGTVWLYVLITLNKRFD